MNRRYLPNHKKTIKNVFTFALLERHCNYLAYPLDFARNRDLDLRIDNPAI